MTITIATKRLIDTLTDALQTADNGVGGVHLSASRAPWRDEPGNVDLLAFTSTDRWTVGHTWIPIDGQIVAAVWPVESAATVLAICKSLLSRRGKDHTVDVDMVRADPPADAKDDEHPGWVVTLSETPALFASDTEFQFHGHPESKFPISKMRRILAPAPELPIDVEESVESALTLWSPSVLAPLVAVAKRRGMALQFFRSQFRSVQVVQIGDTWLGAAMPGTPLPGDHGEQPTIEPVFADAAEAALRDTLKDMAANGITVTVDNPQSDVAQTIADAADRVEVDQVEQLRQAIELVVTTSFASVSMLQRKLHVGFARADMLLERMGSLGIIGAREGSAAPDVLYKPEQVAEALELLAEKSEV